ncbi:hypothetical protein AB0E06_23290 [Streptomyces sp. NPDC048109]|uniref:hypothetical protein n=1 Tax=unclassified Streptomyces TaxID=2593676 RepID=UPI0033FF8388
MELDADLIFVTHRHEVDDVHPVIAAGDVHGDDRADLTVGEVDVADAPWPPASPERITSATASLFGCHYFGSQRAPVS